MNKKMNLCRSRFSIAKFSSDLKNLLKLFFAKNAENHPNKPLFRFTLKIFFFTSKPTFLSKLSKTFSNYKYKLSWIRANKILKTLKKMNRKMKMLSSWLEGTMFFRILYIRLTNFLKKIFRKILLLNLRKKRE